MSEDRLANESINISAAIQETLKTISSDIDDKDFFRAEFNCHRLAGLCKRAGVISEFISELGSIQEQE